MLGLARDMRICGIVCTQGPTAGTYTRTPTAASGPRMTSSSSRSISPLRLTPAQERTCTHSDLCLERDRQICALARGQTLSLAPGMQYMVRDTYYINVFDGVDCIPLFQKKIELWLVLADDSKIILNFRMTLSQRTLQHWPRWDLSGRHGQLLCPGLKVACDSNGDGLF